MNAHTIRWMTGNSAFLCAMQHVARGKLRILAIYTYNKGKFRLNTYCFFANLGFPNRIRPTFLHKTMCFITGLVIYRMLTCFPYNTTVYCLQKVLNNHYNNKTHRDKLVKSKAPWKMFLERSIFENLFKGNHYKLYYHMQ